MDDQSPGRAPGFERAVARLLVSIALVSVVLVASPRAVSGGHSVEIHSCVRGLFGLTWQVVRRHAAYAEITATEPRTAQTYRGTVRALPHSALRLIALHTWGQARKKIGDFHPYAVAYWPRVRPVWLILLNSPVLKPGSTIKVACQR